MFTFVLLSSNIFLVIVYIMSLNDRFLTVKRSISNRLTALLNAVVDVHIMVKVVMAKVR